MKLLYFAWVRAHIGKGHEEIAKPAEVTNAGELVLWLQARGGGYAKAFANPGTIRVAVNQDYVRPDHVLADNDEIALFPPVTGG
jgi:molybdopterin synthase sulfur carrier subunit